MIIGNIEIKLGLTKRFFNFKQKNIILHKIAYWKFILSSSLLKLRNESDEAYSSIFNKYLNNLTEKEKKEKINTLKRGLDEKSQEEIDRFLERQKYIYTHNLIEQKKLFTEEELREQSLGSKQMSLISKKIKKFKLSHQPIETFYAQNGLKYLSEEIKNKIKNGIFLDFGAYEGDSAINFYYNFSPKKIYSFEPEKDNFQKLYKNKKLLNTDKLEIINKGVSNFTQKSKMLKDGGASKITKKGNKGEEVELITIDDFVKENNINAISVIKMDVEGEETNTILGATETIKSQKPVLAISIYHNPHDFFEIKPYLEKLIPEYKFIIKKTNPFSLNLELMLIAYT